MSKDATTVPRASERPHPGRRFWRQRPGGLVLALVLGCLALLALAQVADAAGTGAITGTVTHGPSSSPFKGVQVLAYEATSGHVAGEAVTHTNGDYEVKGLKEGIYKVQFVPPAGSPYLPQYYDEAHTFAGAEEIEVEEGETEIGIEAELRQGGTIEGVVEDGEGDPVAGASVHILGEVEGEALLSEAVTSGSGEYVTKPLPEGKYRVVFYPPFGVNLVPQFFNAKSTYGEATKIFLDEEETEEASATLQTGGEISGTVTDAVTHKPVAHIGVEAVNSGPGEFGGYAETNEKGEYTIVGLATGTYKLEFLFEEAGLGDTYLQPPEEEGVRVTQPQTTSVGNLALLPRAPENSSAPVASGTAAVGQTLSCSTGSWTGEKPPFNYTYQWLRDEAAIAGAGSEHYVVQSADQGHGLACEVTASNPAGHGAARSNTLNVPAAPVSTPAPPALTPKPLVTISSYKLTASGSSARVRLSCSAAPCKGTIELTEHVVVKRHQGHRTISRKRTIILATGSYSLAAGRSGTFVVHLTKEARTKLARAAHHRLAAAITVSVTGGKLTKGTAQLAMVSKHK